MAKGATLMQPSPYTNANAPTTLGIPEVWERVGAYLGIWVTGLLLLIFEQKNKTVRFHARQSLIVFGTLSIIGLVLGMVSGLFGAVPLLGWALAAPFRFLGWLDTIITVVLWLTSMIGAAVNPNFRLPGMGRADRLLR
jgi:uncharacterized membrane protein